MVFLVIPSIDKLIFCITYKIFPISPLLHFLNTEGGIVEVVVYNTSYIPAPLTTI
jgi:hypothetical protein